MKNMPVSREGSHIKSLVIFSVVAVLVNGLSGSAFNVQNVIAAGGTLTVSVNSINGQPPSTACLVSPISVQVTVTASGGKGGPYSTEINWGDGSPNLATSTGSGGNFTRTFTATHTASVVSTVLTVTFYHGGIGGNDGKDTKTIDVPVCVVPPTKAALNITKIVVNNDGGTGVSSNFTLHIKQNNVDIAGSPFVGSATSTGFALVPGTYVLSENPAGGYTQTGITGSCASNGSIIVVAGQNYSCNVTNDDNSPVINHPPVLNPIGNKTINEGDTLSFSASATDADSDPLAFSATGLPAGATFIGNVFTWISSESQGPGLYHATISVTDGAQIVSETIDITVNEINIAPIAAGTSVSTHVDTAKVITLSALDSDVPSQTLSFSIETGPAHGSLSAVLGDQVTYTPDSEFTGPDSFTFKANDGVSDGAAATIAISVDNHAPTLNPIPDQITAELVELNLVGGSAISASDPDGDTLTYSLISAPAGASINSTTGDFAWTASETDGSSAYPVTISVSDGYLVDSQSFQITVNEMNVSPIANSASSTTDEDAPVDIALSASDSDIPAQTVTLSIVTPPTRGSLSTLASGTVTYTPDSNFNGSDTFEFKANDGESDSDTATISIVVNPVNDAPTLALNGSNPMDLFVGDIFTDPGANTSDTEDGTLVPAVSGTVDTGVAGTYALDYSATDSGGLIASGTRSVVIHAVLVNQPPALTLLGGNPITLTLGDSFVDPGATSTDPEDGPLSIVSTSTVNTAQAGTYAVIYSAVDSGGLEAFSTRTVTVNSPASSGTGGGGDSGSGNGGGASGGGGGGTGYTGGGGTGYYLPPFQGGVGGAVGGGDTSSPEPLGTSPVVIASNTNGGGGASSNPPSSNSGQNANAGGGNGENVEGIVAGASIGGEEIKSSTIPMAGNNSVPPQPPLLASIGSILSLGTGSNIIAFSLLFLLLLIIAYLIERNMKREAEAGKGKRSKRISAS